MIAVVTDNAVGGHFLCWSLHYLAGHTDYFNSSGKKSMPLPENPIIFDVTQQQKQPINAHEFLPNRLIDSTDFHRVLSVLSSHNPAQFDSVYMHWLSPEQTLTDPTFEKVKEQILKNTKLGVEKIINHADKIVVVSLPPEMKLYSNRWQGRASVSRSYCDPTLLTFAHYNRWNDYINYFFPDYSEEWRHLQYESVASRRNFLALHLKPFDFMPERPVDLSVVELFDHDQDHYKINAFDLWTQFDQTVMMLFEYLEIGFRFDRYQKWRKIYAHWKEIHTSRILFCQEFDNIINNIINGTDLDLIKFNLDIIQEATIQHHLIYKHSLNFTKQQIQKFTNTKQLHDSLESYTATQ